MIKNNDFNTILKPGFLQQLSGLYYLWFLIIMGINIKDFTLIIFYQLLVGPILRLLMIGKNKILF